MSYVEIKRELLKFFELKENNYDVYIVHYITRIFLVFPCRIVQSDSKLLSEFPFIRHENPDDNKT
jgi:hypothetical protein